MTLSRTARRWFVIAALFFLFMLGVTLCADYGFVPTQIQGIPFFDKFGHFMLFGILAFLLQLALEPRAVRLGRGAVPLAFLIGCALALLDEMQQIFSPYRGVDWTDLTADWLGIALGTLAANFIAHRTKDRRN